MTLSEIRAECWAIARESSTIDKDRLWTKAEMNRYINRVYNFIAKETLCIRDSMSAETCRIHVAPPADLAELTELAATDPYYAQDLVWYNNVNSWLYQELVAPYSFALSPKVLQIDECKWTNHQWTLVKVSVTKWQKNAWWEQVRGLPIEYATDLDTNRIVLNYRMTEDDTLRLSVRRLPLVALIADGDSPEFRLDYHELMVNGVLWQMYSKQDAETIDEAKANNYFAMYMRDVDEIKQQELNLNKRLNPNSSLQAFR